MATQPNILFILLDDIGKEGWDLYPTHRTRSVDRRRLNTPRMTALGEMGRVFDNFWVTPMCMPTRAAFATGALPHRSGYIMRARPGVSAERCAPNTGVIFAAMKAAGYSVGAYGKWHLTFNIEQCPTLPESYDLDDYLITHMMAKSERYWGADTIATGGVTERLAKSTFSDDVTSDRAVAFITTSPQPFYCQWWPNLVHGTDEPFTTTPISRNSQLSNIAKWVHMVRYLDTLVGKILDALIASGRDTNTLVFLTTDNGGKTGIIYGEKGRLTEDGICVPTIAYHPDPLVVAPGRESRLGQITDLLTTFSTLAGTPVTTEDGVDLTPLMTGAEGTPRLYCASQAFDREWAVKRYDGKKIAMPDGCNEKPKLCTPLYYETHAQEERDRGRRRRDLPAALQAVYDELLAEAQRLGFPGA